MEELTFLQGSAKAGEWLHPSWGEEEERKTLLPASGTAFDPQTETALGWPSLFSLCWRPRTLAEQTQQAWSCNSLEGAVGTTQLCANPLITTSVL